MPWVARDCSISPSLVNRDRSSLNGSRETDKVRRENVATVPRVLSRGSRCRRTGNGSGATRIEADVHRTEERESDAQSIYLSGRARRHRAGLTGHIVGGGTDRLDHEVQSQGDPDSEARRRVVAEDRQHPRRRRRGGSRIHDRRIGLRRDRPEPQRRYPADLAGQLLPARGREDTPAGIRVVH